MTPFGAWCELSITQRALAAIVLAIGLAGGARADDAALSRLSWLGGCWSAESGEPGSGEHWMAPAGGSLFGMSRTVKQGKTVAFEFMQIRAGADGKLVFIAQPSGQRTTVFPLHSSSDEETVFENLQHDFPQRVAYRREGGTKLVARIEGLQRGTLRVIEFPMNRVRCD